MINIEDILYEICDDKNVYKKDIDLIESGLLDSYAFIELFTRLEDEGIYLQRGFIYSQQELIEIN